MSSTRVGVLHPVSTPFSLLSKKKDIFWPQVRPSVTEAAEGAVEAPVMMGHKAGVVKELVMARGKEVGMVEESMVSEPVGMEVELPKAEMVEAMAEAEVATTLTVVMVPVMPHRLGRQHHSSYHETPEKKRECNSSHRS